MEGAPQEKQGQPEDLKKKADEALENLFDALEYIDRGTEIKLDEPHMVLSDDTEIPDHQMTKEEIESLRDNWGVGIYKKTSLTQKQALQEVLSSLKQYIEYLDPALKPEAIGLMAQAEIYLANDGAKPKKSPSK